MTFKNKAPYPKARIKLAFDGTTFAGRSRGLALFWDKQVSVNLLLRSLHHIDNIWLTEPTCHDVVLSSWESVAHLDTVEHLLSRIDRCSTELVTWNKSTFVSFVIGGKRREYFGSKKFSLIISNLAIQIPDGQWLPHPNSFKPITPRTSTWTKLKVSDLMDHDSAYWCERLLRQIFFNCDAENDLASLRDNSLWRAIWHSMSPLRSNYLDGYSPPALAISQRVPSLSMSCGICGHIEELDIHASLKCLFASRIWQGCKINKSLWAGRFRSLADCLDQAKRSLDRDSFGDFLAILWEC
ncbi:hypothetical protein Cgig2_012926 [Carnegiea gigantea]|uniref:Reverse transcriptase zinc-binding domain-containing protein n=1 Tax=Carnegiea gigantea TaxID=171969 RepID=A0A9Q1Q610_9CARY|nr:hypothetical protein Cgig2_012926 [Carnegiea gigantea]